jgi:vitamin B12 transporter
MSKKKILALATLVLVCVQLKAQDSIKARQLDEVVITATKFPVKQNMTGKVVSVITKEEIERSKGRSLSQLLNQQAGIVVNGALNNAGSIQSVFMRGAASGRALVLIDGVPAYDPSMINNEFDLNLISLNEVERIEICRGAQSTLYGSDAIAGVINIITVNTEDLKPIGLKATVAGGTQSTFKGNVQLHGQVDKLNYSFGFSKLDTKGFSSAYDSSGKMDFDKDGFHGTHFKAQLGYAFSEHFSLRGFIQNNKYKNDVDASAFHDDKDFRAKNRNLITGGTARFIQNNTIITANYQYSDIRRDYDDDSASVGGFSKFSRNNYYGKSQFLELYASTKLGNGFTLLQGADYRFANMNNQFMSISSFGTYASTFKDTIMSQASLYGSLNYSSADSNLHVELGGRLNVHSRYGSNYTYTFNPSFRISPSFRIFGSIATGYKTPTLFQLYDGFYGNVNLKPEKSLNYEVGIQQQHQVISNRLVFFKRDATDGIDYSTVNFKYFNFLKQKALGLEWEMNLRPADFLTFTANYTYLHVKETTENRKTLTEDTTYGYAIRRPAHHLNASLQFQLGRRATVSTSMLYAGKRYDVGGYMAEDVLLPAYTIFSAQGNLQLNEHFNVFADLQNITNKKFFDLYGYYSIPFVAMAGITVNL